MKEVRDQKLMSKTYGDYYEKNYSFRENWFGRIAFEYIIPKYFTLLNQAIATNGPVTILEIGAGDGEVTDYITKKKPKWSVTPTEPVKAGVDALKKKGYSKAALVDAVNIPYPDQSFDYVICFDVMHHVEGPAQMAHEMLRVARKGVFLIEANRQAIARRLLEKTKIYRMAGEFSYYPQEYRAFFNTPGVKSIKIRPFQFVPPKLSNISLPLTVAISETVAKIPLLKWQCSGLAITIVKNEVKPRTKPKK